MLIKPSFKGELGCLGFELDSYIECITPPNCFGYDDYMVLHKDYNGNYFTFPYYRPNDIPSYIQKQILEILIKLTKEYCADFDDFNKSL